MNGILMATLVWSLVLLSVGTGMGRWLRSLDARGEARTAVAGLLVRQRSAGSPSAPGRQAEGDSAVGSRERPRGGRGVPAPRGPVRQKAADQRP